MLAGDVGQLAGNNTVNAFKLDIAQHDVCANICVFDRQQS